MSRLLLAGKAVVLSIAMLQLMATTPVWAVVTPVETRAESQAAHWLERALPDPGPGLEELRNGILKFEQREYQQAILSFLDASRLGAGTRVEEAAHFLSAESQARSISGPQDIRAAISLLEELRRRYASSPRASWALWRIGSLYLRQGFEQETIARYEMVLRQESAGNPLAPFVRLDLADVYIASGQFAPAANILRIARQYPPDVDSLGQATVGLADVAHAQGQYRQARELYEVVEAQWPTLLQARPVSLFGMGDSYLRLGDWPRARRVLNTGYGLHPRDSFAPVMLARMADGFKLSGQMQQAKNLYLTVVERHPGTEGELSAWLGLAELAEKEAFAGAPETDVRDAYGVILKRWSKHVRAGEALLHIAQSYQRVGALEEAAAAYDQLLLRADSGPWRAQGRQGLETILRSLSAAGNSVEVANLFLRHQAILTTPSVHGPTALVVAATLASFGVVDSAITLMQAALAAGVPAVQVEYGLMALAQAYRKKGDLIHLERTWKDYLRRFPDGAWSDEAREGLLTALSRPGKQEEAAKTCQTYLQGGRGKTASGSKENTDAKAPHRPELVLLCADQLAQYGDGRAGQDLYREIQMKEPDTLDGMWAAYQLARTSPSANLSKEALDFFERVSKTDKDRLLAAAASAHLARAVAPEAPAVPPKGN
ncbi:MAG TPA: tetratricopeptide repeat protein [Nitrospirales bacterium]|jgi:TolA-binding protein